MIPADPVAGMLDAIAAVVAARVVDALRPLLVAAQAPATSALVSRLELARLLAVSAATVTRLTAEGLVCTYVGDSPRYDVEAVRVWLAERGAKPTKAKPSSGPIAGVRLLGRRAAR